MQEKGCEFITGAEAIVRAALDAGCDFFAGYPITPATPILLQMMAALPGLGGIAIQAEDEIAAIGMCIGASLSGARPLTATSGPGISLYSENIGAAIMLEAPIVIVDCQRMGPATGGATTTAQGDVQFLRWGTSGGFPVVVLAPMDAADCYSLTLRAFDLAWDLRLPVFIATEKETVLSRVSHPTSRFIPPRQEPHRASDNDAPIRLYESGEPARVVPLSPFGGDLLVRTSTSSHDEQGYLVKAPHVFENLNRHLIEKVEAYKENLEIAESDLQEGAQVLFLGYGVTGLAVKSAVRQARQAGHKASALVLQSLWPVPERVIRAAMESVQRIVVPELNAGLYRREIERLAERDQQVIGVNRLDGGLITSAQILTAGGFG